jgi:hypothetical protein
MGGDSGPINALGVLRVGVEPVPDLRAAKTENELQFVIRNNFSGETICSNRPGFAPHFYWDY